MSGLSSLCDYGNDSSSDECEHEIYKSELKALKLPLPDLSRVPVVLSEKHIDYPNLHKGRVRNFPHIRGNWASFIYIKYPDVESLLNLIKTLKTLLSVDDYELCDDFHISLSKTLVLNYHTIIPLNAGLKESLGGLERFTLGFDTVDVYCNEEKTRTFLALKVDYFSHKLLSTVLKNINNVLKDFKLNQFYKEPSFHMSIFWMNGDKKARLEEVLKILNDRINQEIVKRLKVVVVDKVHFKSGNKNFQYLLE